MHDTSRSVLAAARTHPAGFAASSAVIVTAIVLFTLVTSGLLPVISPGRSGAGPAPVIQPGTGQPRLRTVPQQAVPTGPPVVPGLTIGLGSSTPSLTGRSQQAAAPATGSGSASGVSQHLPSRMAGGCPAYSAGQTPVTAATATGATGSNAPRDTIRVLGNASAATALTATAGSAVQAVTALTSTAASAIPVDATVSVSSSSGSGAAQVSQTPVAAVTAAVSAAVPAVGQTLTAIAQVQGTPSDRGSRQGDTGQGGSNQNGSSQPMAQAGDAQEGDAQEGDALAGDAQASSGMSAVPVSAPVTLNGPGSVQGSANQALPVTVSLPGAG